MTEAELIRWGVGLGAALSVWFLGWLVQRFGMSHLARLLHKTPTDLDDALLYAIRPHIPIWFLLAGVLAGARYVGLTAGQLGATDSLVQVAFIISVTFATATFLVRLVATRSTSIPGALPATTLIQNAVRIVVIALGALMVVTNLGIAVTPILTALGVGSLAVALALQPTLSNLFAGFYVTLAQQVRVGDYVELESGQAGFIEDIGWRSTQIRELPNNIVIVPNARIAEIIVKNYSLPSNEQSALVQVGVSYGSDLARVEAVTIEVAKEVPRSVQGGLAEFEPFTRYHTFGDSSINFSVILRVQQFTDRYLVSHEFVKRLHRRYAEEGIEIPFPQRVITMATPVDVGAPRS
jgi:small-conductance mechanosensitive channel